MAAHDGRERRKKCGSMERLKRNDTGTEGEGWCDGTKQIRR